MSILSKSQETEAQKHRNQVGNERNQDENHDEENEECFADRWQINETEH